MEKFMVSEGDKLDELVVEVFKGYDGPIEAVSKWYQALDTSGVDVPKIEHLPDGKTVCPGSPKTCLWAGWCPGFDRICDECLHQMRCYPPAHDLPLTEPVILEGVRPMSFAELGDEE